MTQPIWYDSTEAGAPTLNNAAGSMLEVLRACLVNGFGARAVTSISVSGGVATATCAGHGFSGLYGKRVLVAGAAAAGLNGAVQIGAVTTNSFTYAAPGVPDGTYTGTISARRAPLGWQEQFSAGNVSVFARTVVRATAAKLRVDDTGTDMARVIQVEAATGVNSFAGLSPTSAQFSGGGYWQKHNAASANRWFIVGDERGLWLGVRCVTSPEQFAYYFFGDGVPYYAGDAYFTVLTFQITAFFSGSPVFPMATAASYNDAPIGSTGVYCVRGQGVGSTGSEVSAVAGPNTGGQAYGGSNLQASTFEHVAMVGGLHVIGAVRQIRGEMPGIHVPLASTPFASMTPVIGGDGRVYLPVSFNHGGLANGQICLQLSGGWY